MSDLMKYNDAVLAIKAAILQSQYRAAKASNAEQLSLYYAVGGYVSANTRSGTWGTGAIDAISEQLQKELPGLRGFTPRNLRLMRTFYEEWQPTFAQFEGRPDLELASAELANGSLAVWNLQIPDSYEAFARDFLSVEFTHHRWILSLAKDSDERFFYIRKCAQEHLSVEALLEGGDA